MTALPRFHQSSTPGCSAMGDVLEQKEAQLAEVLAASNLDPATLTQLNAVSAPRMPTVTAWLVPARLKAGL